MDDPDYDADKVDDAVLALLWLTAWREAVVPAGALGDPLGPGEPAAEVWRAWKGFEWGALDRLHAEGLIHDPTSKSRSVYLTAAGRKQAEALFRDLFGREGEDSGASV